MPAPEPGGVVSLDRLIDELWAGERSPDATRTPQAQIAHPRGAPEPGRGPRGPPKALLVHLEEWNLRLPARLT